MGTAVVSLTITDKQDTACQTTTPCKSKHCSSAALLEQDICKNFVDFFLKYCQPRYTFLILIISRTLQAAICETKIFMFMQDLVLHFFRFIFLVLSTHLSGHTSAPLFHTSCTLYCFPLQFYLLPPFFQDLPIFHSLP